MAVNSAILTTSQNSLMNFWHSICNEKTKLCLPTAKWKRKWSCNEASAMRLYNGIRILKPKVIVETGTFEGLGTFTMAKAAHENNNGARIFTIDYDGDPTTKLQQEDWLELKQIREHNLDTIRREFPKVEINFIEGDSRKVLPQLFSSTLKHWDFFYQDSMHFMEGILSEWEVMRKFLKAGSVVVFDDIALTDKAKATIKQILGINNQFTEYFFWNEVVNGDWCCRSIADDHPQFWAQKIK